MLQRLADAGNTVLVIEHNLDVIKQADWIVDLGPEGGEAGGEVIATGTPEQVAAVESSYTGQFLRELLAGGAAGAGARQGRGVSSRRWTGRRRDTPAAASTTSPTRCSGTAEIDLVYIPGWVSHLDLHWERTARPAGSSSGSRRFTRLIVFDKRGIGLCRTGSTPTRCRRWRSEWTTSGRCSTPSAASGSGARRRGTAARSRSCSRRHIRSARRSSCLYSASPRRA